MKKVFIMAISFAIYSLSMAQKSSDFEGAMEKGSFILTAGGSASVPVTNLDGFTFGVGADATAIYGLSEKLGLTGDVGYTNMFIKDGGVLNVKFIPIRVGARVYATDKLFFGAKVGLGLITFGGLSSETGFAYSGGAGYQISEKIDLGVNYDATSLKGGSVAYTGLRLGYRFK